MKIFNSLKDHKIVCCFLLSFLFCFLVVFLPIFILELLSVGVPSSVIDFSYRRAMDYSIASISISNPITIASFGATIVGFSLTILGFSINAFSKSTDDLVVKREFDVQPKTVEILLTRYRGFRISLGFLNPLAFPLLSRVFCLLLLVIFMFIQAFVGKFRIFYLGIMAFIMLCINFSIILDTFRLLGDRNFSILNASKIVKRTVKDRINRLCVTSPKDTSDFKNDDFRLYSKIDLLYALKYLYYAKNCVVYLKTKDRKVFEIELDYKKYENVILELCLFIAYGSDLENKNNCSEKQTSISTILCQLVSKNFIKTKQYRVKRVKNKDKTNKQNLNNFKQLLIIDIIKLAKDKIEKKDELSEYYRINSEKIKNQLEILEKGEANENE